MKAISSSQLLGALQFRVESHIDQAITTYQNLSEAQLKIPSATGGWSIAQCLEHLNSYGDYYLPEIKMAINAYAGKPGLYAKRGWLGNYFINMMNPDLPDKGYKAFKGHVPCADLKAYNTVARFIDQQKELLKLLGLARKTDLNTLRVPTSIFSWIRLRLGDTFEFLTIHNERHIRQANRNLLI